MSTSKALYNTRTDDEFLVKVASSQKEIKVLLEKGFEYVMSKDDIEFFRKRR